MATTDPFDGVAAQYDAWYDSPEGRALFDQEVEALLLVKGRVPGRWLEVGVGTGRFAAAFGVQDGVDPSLSMRSLAAQRGIRAQEGAAEALPYDDGSFDGVLVVATLCFTTDPARSLREFTRVLRPGGALVIGLIPSASPWGQEYARKGAAGHPLFSRARFLDVDETVRMAAEAGLILTDAASALLQPPGRAPAQSHRVERGAIPGAGFVALRFKSRGRPAGTQDSRPSTAPHPTS